MSQVIYSYVPAKVQKVMAKFKGLFAHCGACDKKLGKFFMVDGEIKCTRTGCGAISVLKK